MDAHRSPERAAPQRPDAALACMLITGAARRSAR
jgi:hypothetical protein